MSLALDYAECAPSPRERLVHHPAELPSGAPGPHPSRPHLYDVARGCAPLVEPVGAPVRPGRETSLASVSVLRAPRPSVLAPAVRLTRRGVLVLAVAVAALGAVLVWIAALSAPGAASPPAAGPARVSVQAGDTLWALAVRIAPDTDPRAEVATLQRLNHLRDTKLTPGQLLRVR